MTSNLSHATVQATLRYHLDAIQATPAMRRLLFKIWRQAGYQHAMQTLRGWSET